MQYYITTDDEIDKLPAISSTELMNKTITFKRISKDMSAQVFNWEMNKFEWINIYLVLF